MMWHAPYSNRISWSPIIMPSQRFTPLPRGWPNHIKSSLLHAISLAAMALTVARSRVVTSRCDLQVKLDQASTEIALLKEELAIKDGRWSRLPSRRRPHFTSIQRMRILQVRAGRGWSCEQAAQAFMIDEQTMRSWLRRVDEEGEGVLIRISEPVNKFPDFVRYLVKQLRVLLPTMGKTRIAQVLARAGLHLGVTTVGRILKETEPMLEDAATPDIIETRVVTARHPGEVWHVDLTTVPTGSGFWVPWIPFALPQSWPFCWWVGVVVDQFSRAVVGFAIFRDHPTSGDIQSFLDRAIRNVNCSPKYIITDKGRQFWCDSFRQWCRGRAIRPRFGAVGKYGSVAVIERFIRSMKNEYTKRILIPLRLDAIRRELGSYVIWYNMHRPGQALGGRTPWEVHAGFRPANATPRFETRRDWPTGGPCASPQTAIRGRRGTKLTLVLGYVNGRRHLPVVELRKAA
jgi:transposase InsO family protein